MFGPGKSAWGPLTFALAVRADEAREVELVRALLAHPYARVVAMPFAEHDRRMGWLLGLAHLSGMLFASALARSGLDAAELEETASTTYARQKATALSMPGVARSTPAQTLSTWPSSQDRPGSVAPSAST